MLTSYMPNMYVSTICLLSKKIIFADFETVFEVSFRTDN